MLGYTTSLPKLLLQYYVFAKQSNLYDLSHYKSVYYSQFCLQKFK
jgi:hypothetical protein